MRSRTGLIRRPHQFPNIAFDSHGAALQYGRTEDSEKSAMASRENHRKIPATRATPILKLLAFDSAAEPFKRLAGPLSENYEYSPNEAIMTYRFFLPLCIAVGERECSHNGAKRGPLTTRASTTSAETAPARLGPTQTEIKRIRLFR